MENLEEKVDEILERGILVDFLPTKKEFKEALMGGKKLRFYMGFDPTAKSLHLGHSQGLMILEDFRKLGHEVIFLIGDFTGMIGDPSDKSSARVKQTPQQVQENFSLWKDQVKNIASFDDDENPFQIRYNSQWLGKLNFADVLELASNFTVQQMLERDMFEKRLLGEVRCNKCGKGYVLKSVNVYSGDVKKFQKDNPKFDYIDIAICSHCGHKNEEVDFITEPNKPIYLHEFLYPLMQGYDSVAMDVDVELCGTDQIFNALAGRTLMQKLKNKNKFVISAKLIADEKTGMLMSKSNGTGVFLDLDANNLFGAIMSQPDGMLRPLFVGCTRVSLAEIDELMGLENPRDAKIKLAFEIVNIYHGAQEAEKAKDYFVRTISNKEMPSVVDEIIVPKEEIKLVEFIVLAGFAKSNGEARRKIEQGGVEVAEKRAGDWQRILKKEDDGAVVKVGKFNFAKIRFA